MVLQWLALPAKESARLKSLGLLAIVYHCSGCAMDERSSFNFTSFIPFQKSKGKPGTFVFINNKIGIDGIPHISSGHRLDDLSFILPFVISRSTIQCLLTANPMQGCIFPPKTVPHRTKIFAIIITDIRRPHAAPSEIGDRFSLPNPVFWQKQLFLCANPSYQCDREY